MIIKQSSTARELVFLLLDSADHITGKTGLSPTVTLSKNGGSFASPSGSVTEIANGWYKVAGNATDTGTLGALALHATGTGADPCDMLYEVVAVNVDDTVRMGLTALPNAAAEAAGGLYTRGTGAGQINQEANGYVSVNLKAILGTVLTETAGLIAAGFKKFFNVATPTGTVNSLPDAVPDASGGLPVTGNRLTAIPTVAAVTTVTNLTNAPTNGDLTAAMKTSVTTAATAATPTASLTAAESRVFHSGTAQAGSADSITLAAGASSVFNLYTCSVIKIYGGTGAGQARVISNYDGSTKIVSIDRNWQTTPDNTSIYSIFADDTSPLNDNLAPDVEQVLGVVHGVIGDVTGNLTGSVGSVTGLTASNLDATVSSRLATSGYTAPLSAAGTRSAIGLASANLDTQLDALPTNAELATALGTADDAVLAAIAALNNLSQANIRTAVGLGSANLDTQLDALPTNAELATALGTADDAVLAAIAALNNLSQANVRTAAGLGSANLDTQLSAIAAYIDTEVAAIKAKTDNLPVDPADASDIAASFASIASSLTTLASYVDTEVAAIKAKTDNLPAAPAATGDAMTLTSGERTSIGTAVWASATRTLSSFGTLVADVATAVWGAAARTLTAFGFTVAPTAAAVADAVWDETASDHVTAGSTGAALAAGDPWSTPLPGAYGVGTAGNILGALSPNAPPGAFAETVTVKDGGVAIADALVTVSDGQNSWKALTDVNGIASFWLNAGVYTVSISKPGYAFKSSSITVTG
jgi:hypothetical protein